MVQVVTVLGCPRPVGAVCEYPTCVEEGHCEAGPYPGSDKSQPTAADVVKRLEVRFGNDGKINASEVLLAVAALSSELQELRVRVTKLEAASGK